MPGNDDRAESTSTGRTAIPAAFSRDAAPPPPPRDDPHWVEFYPTDASDASDSLPEWLLWGLPLGLAGVMMLHGVLALVLLLLFRR